MKPVRIASVGLANYASNICNVLDEQSQRDDAPVQFVAVAEINQAPHGEKIAALKAKGIDVYEQFDQMIQRDDIEAVWLPLPIPLHRPFTEKALAAGKAVMSEKPAAGTIDDVDAMIAARDKAGLPVAIGFQTMYDPHTLHLKRRLLEGAIGPIRSVIQHSTGPRGDKYYNRAEWAGSLTQNGQWVLDGPATNAHAHHLNLSMFLAGPSESESAQPVAIEAELYRANPITSYDTSAIRLEMDNGVSVMSLLTHACARFIDDTIVVEGERGRAYVLRDVMVIETPEGTEVLRQGGNSYDSMVERFAKLVRGETDAERGYATLENARAQVLAVNGAVQATPIREIPDDVSRWADTSQGRARAVREMESMVRLCAMRGTLLHESGLFDWTQPAGRLDLRGYDHFAGPAQADQPSASTVS